MTARYATRFERTAREDRAALVPFVMLGFPDAPRSLAVCETFIAAGADALELGIPFSDAVADGPVIQAAAEAARAAGATPRAALALVAELRRRHPELPLGLLCYANLLEAAGVENFYAACAAAGADSVLVADVPTEEFAPYAMAAAATGIAPILIVPPNASSAAIRVVARHGRGYTYLSGRAGVTGTHAAMNAPTSARIAELAAAGAPPPLVGFGVSTAAHVAAARAAGAAGVVVGSALVEIVARHADDAAALDQALRAAFTVLRAPVPCRQHGTGLTVGRRP